MASSSSSGSSDSGWSFNKRILFPVALEVYKEDTPDRWEKIASFIGGKTAEEVKLRYDRLMKDNQNPYAKPRSTENKEKKKYVNKAGHNF